ncbi:cytosolic non-specific dipeptidase-like protein [Labeo rohita]|uniref:Cytosolic non-specific dipeptidase-like protein n=1 Tax=Labeo rohita TaxID=84645 RepID=A0A498L9Z2_LABRO|nr:cytosolic non-specific dipeptidase-like protein [Labeo rohita]
MGRHSTLWKLLVPKYLDMMNCISLVCLLLCTGVSSFRFEELTQYVNSHEEEFIETLRQWIAVESDSSDVTKRSDLHRMMDMTAEKLRLIGGSVEMVDVGTQSLPNGSSIALPKVVTAQFGSDPSKRTVCVYGHVDVQPAKKEDGWATEPYELTDIDGNLYGRGASDNKAPVLAWIHTVEVYKALNIDLPVNVKFIIEGMEETGSNGLDDMIVAQKDSFFSDVDYTIISDCVWLSKRPALTYGTRGNCYFFAEVEGPKKDLHSGVYGGTVIEPMTDLIGILDKLISPSGKILIPGIREAVAHLSDDEWRMYQDIQFDLETYKQDVGMSQLMYTNKARQKTPVLKEQFLTVLNVKVDLLAHRWRHPTVSIHGIEGAFSSSGTKTVIPAKVIGKFSIRQVPNMDPAVVEKQVTDYLRSVFAKRNSPNKLNVTMVIGAKPWLADPKHPLYEAGKAAVKRGAALHIHTLQ